MLDSFGREIRYLRISVTDRCNLRCVYCMPAEGVRLLRREDILGYEEIAGIAEAAVRLGFDKFRLTGGEPLVRKDFPRLVSLLAAIPGIGALCMTTNGTLLAPLAEDLRRRGLNSVNVSLDTLDPARYRDLTRGGRLRDALDGIEAAAAAGLAVKLNVVAADSLSGRDLAEVRAYAERIGAGVQTIARYSLRERKTDREGFDRPPRCAGCDRIRLLADGTLRPCLHSSFGVKADPEDPERSIREAVAAKPERGLSCEETAVSGIGG